MAAKRTVHFVVIATALLSAAFAVGLSASASTGSALLDDKLVETVHIGFPIADPERFERQDGGQLCPLQQFIQLNSNGTGTIALMERPLMPLVEGPLIGQYCRSRFPADSRTRQSSFSSTHLTFSVSEFDHLKSALSQLSGPLNFEAFERVGSVLPSDCQNEEDGAGLDGIGVMIVRSDDTAISYTIPSRQVAAMGQGKCAQNSSRERQLIQTFVRNLPSNEPFRSGH